MSTANSAPPRRSVVLKSGRVAVLSSRKKANESGKLPPESHCWVRVRVKLTVLLKVSSCRNWLNKSVSVSVSRPGDNVPETPPWVSVAPKVPSVEKSLIVMVLLPSSPSFPMKSKTREAVPDRDDVSRVNCRAVALAGSGAAHKTAARLAANTEK